MKLITRGRDAAGVNFRLPSGLAALGEFGRGDRCTDHLHGTIREDEVDDFSRRGLADGLLLISEPVRSCRR